MTVCVLYPRCLIHQEVCRPLVLYQLAQSHLSLSDHHSRLQLAILCLVPSLTPTPSWVKTAARMILLIPIKLLFLWKGLQRLPIHLEQMKPLTMKICQPYLTPAAALPLAHFPPAAHHGVFKHPRHAPPWGHSPKLILLPAPHPRRPQGSFPSFKTLYKCHLREDHSTKNFNLPWRLIFLCTIFFFLVIALITF